MQREPLVVVGGREPWPGGAVEALLRGHGYRFRQVSDTSEAAAVIRSEQPDLIILSPEFRDGDGFSFCRTLRQRRWLATTPVFFLCTDGRLEEVSALEAGAWDALQCPLDPELFLARVRNAVQTKRQADEAMREGLIDSLTGCYNDIGLRTRLREEMLVSRRRKQPLACLAVALDSLAEMQLDRDPETVEFNLRAAASVLRLGCRRTDVLGRFSDFTFGIVAPATDRDGCRKLVGRLVEAFQHSPTRQQRNGTSVPLQPIVGVTVRNSWPDVEEAPEILVDEAARALRMARSKGLGMRMYRRGDGTAGG